jgi:hypothetical protein
MAVPARAQDYPKWELYGGFSYLRSDFNRTDQSLRGWNFTLTQNLKPWFGGMLEFTGHYAAPGGIQQNVHTFMYGPVFSFRRGGFTPSAHAVLGAVRGSQTYLGLSQMKWNFGAAFGGAVEVKVHRLVGIRIIQADYMLTPFRGVRQENLRASAGIVFYLGH